MRTHSIVDYAIKRHFLNAAATADKSKLQKKRKNKNNSLDEKAASNPDEIANRSLYLHWRYHQAGLQRDKLWGIFDATLKIVILSRKE